MSKSQKPPQVSVLLRRAITVNLQALLQLTAPHSEGSAAAVASVRRIGSALSEMSHRENLSDLSHAADQLISVADRQALDLVVNEAQLLLSAPDSGEAVLLVHPDEAVRHLIRNSISSFTDSIVEANSLFDARAILCDLKGSPGAVLISIDLPDGDGREFLLELRADPLSRLIPILMLGGTDDWAVAESLSLGAQGVFSQPSSQLLQLSNAVAAFLGFEDRMFLEMLFDPMTGVLTGDDFCEQVDQTAEDYALYRCGSWSIVVAQIHNHALLQESCGPQAVDDAVADLVSLLRDRLPEDVAIGRVAQHQVAMLFRTSGSAVEPFFEGFPTRLPGFSANSSKNQQGFGALLSVSGLEPATLPPNMTARGLIRTLPREAPGKALSVRVLGEPRRDLVLLAEDDSLFAKVVIRLVERLGLKVIHREDGASALELAQSEMGSRFVMVILDLHMPRMDGVQVLRALRANEQFEDTPILVLTSYLDSRHVVQVLEYGATDYVSKPFPPDVLTARIRKALRDRHRAHQLKLETANATAKRKSRPVMITASTTTRDDSPTPLHRGLEARTPK